MSVPTKPKKNEKKVFWAKKIFGGKFYTLWHIASGARRLRNLPRAPEKYNASPWRLLPAAMLERWPHVCRVKITFGSLWNIWFVATKTKSTKCFVNCFALRSNQIRPNLNDISFVFKPFA